MAKILIIEDDQATAIAQAYQLWNAGHEVETAGNGRNGIQLTQEMRPDLILLDYDLPDLNGLEVLGEIRQQGIEVPVVMVTGRRDETLAVRAMKNGFADYVVKSGSHLEQLNSVVQETLNRGGALTGPLHGGAKVGGDGEMTHALLNASLHPTLLVSQEGKVQAVNKAGEALFSIKAGHWVHSHIPGMQPIDTSTDVSTPMEKVLETGEPMTFEEKIKGRHMKISLWPVFGRGGQVTTVAIGAQDFTDVWQSERTLELTRQGMQSTMRSQTENLKRAYSELQQKNQALLRTEMALRRSEENLKRAQEIAGLGSWELDPRSGSLWVSEEIPRILGLGPDDRILSLEDFLQWVHPEDRACFRELMDPAIHLNQPFELDVQIQAGGDGEAYVFVQGEPMPGAMDGGTRIMGILLDITTRKKAERMLQKNRSLMLTAFDSFPHWFFVKDQEGRYLMVNEAFAAAHNRKPGYFIGKTSGDLGLFTEEQRAVFAGQEQKLLETGEVIQLPGIAVQLTSEREETFNQIMSPLYDQGEVIGIVGMLENVSYLKRTEKDRLLMGRAVEQSTEGILISDHNGRIEYANKAFARITGISQKQAVSDEMDLFLIAAEGVENGAFHEEKVRQGEVWKGRTKRQGSNGVCSNLESTVSPILDAGGHISAFVLVMRDITRQAQMEASLQQSQKLEAIGTLASGIAHEVNNMLTPVMGYLEMLSSLMDEGTKELEYTGQLRMCAEGIRDIISQLLSVSRKSKGGRQVVNLSDMVRETMKLVRFSLPKTVQVETVLPEIGMITKLDTSQFKTVLMNLCINAGHAMPKGGKLTVSLDQALADADGKPLGENASHARLRVTDTGTGMDKHTMERIFEPFYTTKEPGKGTGLGLYMAYNIIKEQNGVITVDSEPGKGTAFEILMPNVEIV